MKEICTMCLKSDNPEEFAFCIGCHKSVCSDCVRMKNMDYYCKKCLKLKKSKKSSQLKDSREICGLCHKRDNPEEGNLCFTCKIWCCLDCIESNLSNNLEFSCKKCSQK